MTDPQTGPASHSGTSAVDAIAQLRALSAVRQPLVPPELRVVRGTARPASVLILFGSSASDVAASAPDLSVLLQLRASTLREHAGQVSFPGGRREPGDADAVQTALREASEETGLDPSTVEVLAELAPVPLPVSNHSVTPVIGWWASPVPLRAMDRAETSRVWQVPVAQLLDPATRFTAVIHRGGRDFASPAFDVDGTIVWGFTGIVLDRLFDAVGWTLDWDASRRRDIPA
ncbi:NUDIX hydrolase [Humibacter ginsenosidimutans]|uniref:CoA pyrophosphatase n=1 Tax=Humibacter ginsenosidimutans TaxID=2599293 RepID=A0A5B8M2L1_9MICO|nr:CoA pyrophosphatase [Humibacter ginsenosidimutans]QDZ14159.1 CoA pyrophosphatase [Humibacter ginsenosidimutans]